MTYILNLEERCK